MTGLGFIVMDLLKLLNRDMIDGRNAVLPIGILLVFVSLGFLIYFFIMNSKKKQTVNHVQKVKDAIRIFIISADVILFCVPDISRVYLILDQA